MSADDCFLAGGLTAIIERELNWPRDSFDLFVREGVATITLYEDDPDQRSQIEDLKQLPGIKGINVTVATKLSLSQKKEIAPCKTYSFLGVKPNTVPFPVGDLFWPLLADPKQPQFFVSFRRYRTPADEANAAAVGYGETFGLYRQFSEDQEKGLQVSISGALFAQFNLDSPSNDLINADYTIGIPVSFKKRRSSIRMRIYHQSSHLGDEYLLNAEPQRINLSFESFEFLFSRDWRPWRIVAGGEYMFHREPSDLKPIGIQGGIEFYGKHNISRNRRWLGGLYLKSWEEHDWSLDASLKMGLEFGEASPGNRRLRIMVEGYKGYAPHGQFYNDRISYYGIGMYFGF